MSTDDARQSDERTAEEAHLKSKKVFFQTRFVHSKFLLTDHGYIHGSANIADRCIKGPDNKSLDLELGVVIYRDNSADRESGARSGGARGGPLPAPPQEQENFFARMLHTVALQPWLRPLLKTTASDLPPSDGDEDLPPSLALKALFDEASRRNYDTLSIMQCGKNSQAAALCSSRALAEGRMSLWDFVTVDAEAEGKKKWANFYEHKKMELLQKKKAGKELHPTSGEERRSEERNIDEGLFRVHVGPVESDVGEISGEASDAPRRCPLMDVTFLRGSTLDTAGKVVGRTLGFDV